MKKYIIFLTFYIYFVFIDNLYHVPSYYCRFLTARSVLVHPLFFLSFYFLFFSAHCRQCRRPRRRCDVLRSACDLPSLPIVEKRGNRRRENCISRLVLSLYLWICVCVCMPKIKSKRSLQQQQQQKKGGKKNPEPRKEEKKKSK